MNGFRLPGLVTLFLLSLVAAPAAAQDAREGFVGVARLGFVFEGGGEAETECDGDCAGFASTEDDFDEESGFVLGMDFMGHVSQNLRLGGGLLFVPSNEVEFDDGGDYESGSDLSAQFIVEGVFDVSPTVALAVRGQGGALLLFPGEDLDDGLDDLDAFCDSVAAECDINEGPYLGFTFGAGGGAIFDVGPVGLRADLILQWYTLNLGQTEIDSAAGDAEIHTNLTGTRWILAGGVEF